MDEPNLNDERILPFEGRGVISTWEIELPTNRTQGNVKSFSPFDYDTIADVIFHIRYTARDGGASFKDSANIEIVDSANRFLEVADQNGMFHFISMKHDFGTALHKLLYPNDTATYKISIDLTKQHFPYLFQHQDIEISNVIGFVKLRNQTLLGGNNFPLTINGSAGTQGALLQLGDLSHTIYNNLAGDISTSTSWEVEISENDIQTLPNDLKETIDGKTRIKADEIKNIGFLVQFSIK